MRFLILLIIMMRVAIPTTAAAVPRSIMTSSAAATSENGSGGTKIATAQEEVKRIWRRANAVCFDIDSTVCQDEGIDELAAYLGVGEAVANVTRNAMSGNGRFREALAARLQVMKPSADQLEQFINITKPKLTPGIKELVALSGGFRRLIVPVAELLGVEKSHIFANEILFDKNGKYAGFDTTELTSDSGSKDTGKPAVISLLKKKFGYKTIVMVGDGATDAEASPPADAFIGFGGNVIREAVKQRSNWYVTDFDVLRKELDHIDSSDSE
ncbi:unnamed protein product [Caenorhabditis angaria]|uniref:Phosphoserine phosphatase n=1 Tax=Caenorhabditis angaria TaxID=860376 RepID=A0A9P1IP34_9PELO|nr:unnamed protein product [Caenorhabditis angaria]